MDAETNVEPHGALMRLYRHFKDCESWLIHQHVFQELGIRTTQVTLMNDESLQFEPCFFIPHPEKLIPICYFNASRDEDDRRPDPRLDTLPENPFPDRHPLPTNPRPTFEAILKEAREKRPDGDWLGDANRRYGWELHTWAVREDEIDLSARELWDYMEFFLGMPLEIQSSDSDDDTPRGFEKLDHWFPRRKEDPVLEEFEPGFRWNMIEMYRYRGRRPPLPHMIVSVYSNVHAAGPDQGLTLHEVRATVNLMVVRTNHKPFRTCDIHPVLLTSYMGPHHARIIQAAYDGEGLSIQYSQLFSFEAEATAPIELFLRYNISRPVGLEDVDVCMR